MPDRHFPVRPNLEQLRHQAKDLLRAVRRGEESAVAEFQRHHPESIDPGRARLTEAQFALARSYGIASWPRLVHACQLIDAIWRDDADAVGELIRKQPKLIHENARATGRCNWGPPMSYAANLGRDQIIKVLYELGATDLSKAIDRAVLQSQIATARMLREMGALEGGRPPRGALMGPAETLSDAGMAYLLELGVEIADDKGNRLAPVALVLQTYCRRPSGKHRCLDLLAEHGIELPDTPTMAVHRGRVDLLERHLSRDPTLVTRTYSHQDIYPPELGCDSDESLALHGTPLAGTSLLHLCVDFDELDVARWLVAHGADVNRTAEVDPDGFGGHTAIFGCVVSQTYRVGQRRDDAFARFLVDSGADHSVRATLRKRLRFVEDESTHEYRDVTPVSWGERFHDQSWVSQPVLQLLQTVGGPR